MPSKVTLSLLFLFVAIPEHKCQIDADSQYSYPWVISTNSCLTNGSIYDRCSTPQNLCYSTVCCLGLTPKKLKAEDNCLYHRNCTYLVHYEYQGPTNVTDTDAGTWVIHNESLPMSIRVHMTSTRTSPHYLAYALSTNDKMGSDIVFVCELKLNKSVHFYLRWNHQKTNVRAHIVRGRRIAENVTTNFDAERNEVHCEFQLPVNLKYFHLWPTWNFSLIKDNTRHNKYYDLLAAGTVASAGELQDHEQVFVTGHVNNRWSYTNQCVITPGNPTYMTEKLHAGYMVTVWVILLPVNSFMVRFFKVTWAAPFHILGPRWLVIHIFLSFVSVLMTYAGYLLSSGSTNFQVTTYFPANIHSFLGFMSIALLTLQTVTGYLRHRSVSGIPSTAFLQRFHAHLYIPVLLVGYLTIGTAPFLTYNVAPCGIYHLLYPFIIVQVAFYGLMFRNHQVIDRNLGHDEQRALTNFPLLPMPNETITRRISRKRLVLLSAYAVASLGFGTLIFCELIYEDTFGVPCKPNYRHRRHKT